jgi:hypothetical protein
MIFPALAQIRVHLQGSLLLESVDETARASIVRVRLARLIKLREDLLGKALAQLDTPLVEAVDVPDGALGEGEVLVVDDQGTQSGWGDLVGENGRRGAVAQEGLVGDKVLWRALGFDLVGGLTDHERLSLGKEVGRKHPKESAIVSALMISVPTSGACCSRPGCGSGRP